MPYFSFPMYGDGDVLDHEPFGENGRESGFAVPAALGVEEGVLGSGRWLPSLSLPSTEPPVCSTPKRTCPAAGCGRIIISASHDPHNVPIYIL